MSNCLLELNIRTRTYDAYWMPTADGSEALWPWLPLSGLVRHLPCLRRSKGFHFEPGIEVIWDHRLTFLRYPRRKTILYVRDLRDAIYSHYCRELKNVQAPAEDILPFVANHRTWEQYFPGLFDLNDIDTIAYFYLIWMQAIPAEQLLILRFEDRVRDPLAQLKQALDFLGVDRTDAEMQRACEASSLQRFQSNEAPLQQQEIYSPIYNRAGRIGEWRQYLNTEILDCFKGPAALALQNLGYEVPDDSWPTEPLALPAELQIWLDQGQFVQAKNWLIQAISKSQSTELDLLYSQLLALLWSETMLGIDQFGQTHAGPIIRRMCQLNAHYCQWPQLKDLYAQLQNPDCYLYHVSQLPRILVFQIPDLAQAIQIAYQQEAEFCLYQAPSIAVNQMQIQALLRTIGEQFPELGAVVPCQDRQTALTEVGAAIQYVQLTQIPDCILFHTKALLGLDLNQPSYVWLHNLLIAEALGCSL